MGVAPNHLAAGEDVERAILRTGRYLANVSASYTRPADTDAYTAGDVVAQSTTVAVVLTFAAAARWVGGSGRITGARLHDSALAATKLEGELWLYRVAPVMQQDNAPWTPADAEQLQCCGVIVFGATPKLGTLNALYNVTALDLNFKCSAVADLYGVLVTRSAYTPASAGVLTIELDIEQD